MAVALLISAARSPRPEPRMIATDGCKAVRVRIAATASCTWSYKDINASFLSREELYRSTYTISCSFVGQEVLHRRFNALAHQQAIYLSGGNMGVAEQFLNRAQFHPVLQHGNRERMAQHMRRNLIDIGPFRVPLNNEPEALTGKTLTMM